ncbi:YceI family protein [Microbacterium sp. ZXX196]|uniref:YceI family protein n=1 Tax=Microbacterium sp. ZXX196 TaxID=2609291 RepID=UPI0013236219|nr:YceI family protein [Microbacterium sp. ZXX196]
MTTKTKILVASAAALVVLVAAALVAGPRLYASWAEGRAGDAPTNTIDGPVPDEAAEYTGTLTVSDGSVAGYRVDEVLQGEDVTVRGSTDQVTGEASVTDGTLTDVTIEVDVASIETDSEQRDAYFRSTALETDQFPTATFTLTEPAELEAGNDTVVLTGTFEIHGVTQPAEVTAHVAADGDIVQVAGEIPLIFADYGVAAPNLGFVSVEDEGSIEFALVLAAE